MRTSLAACLFLTGACKARPAPPAPLDLTATPPFHCDRPTPNHSESLARCIRGRVRHLILFESFCYVGTSNATAWRSVRFGGPDRQTPVLTASDRQSCGSEPHLLTLRSDPKNGPAPRAWLSNWYGTATHPCVDRDDPACAAAIAIVQPMLAERVVAVEEVRVVDTDLTFVLELDLGTARVECIAGLGPEGMLIAPCVREAVWLGHADRGPP